MSLSYFADTVSVTVWPDWAGKVILTYGKSAGLIAIVVAKWVMSYCFSVFCAAAGKAIGSAVSQLALSTETSTVIVTDKLPDDLAT